MEWSPGAFLFLQAKEKYSRIRRTWKRESQKEERSLDPRVTLWKAACLLWVPAMWTPNRFLLGCHWRYGLRLFHSIGWHRLDQSTCFPVRGKTRVLLWSPWFKNFWTFPAYLPCSVKYAQCFHFTLQTGFLYKRSSGAFLIKRGRFLETTT